MDKISNSQPLCNKKGRLIRKAVEVRSSRIDGCGVFADQIIFPGEIIEECPIVLVELSPTFYNHVFKWSEEIVCLPLGYGAVYNHSKQHNAHYVADKENRLLKIIANKLIYRGDEIFISYGENWFEARNLQDITNPFSKSSQKQDAINWSRVIRLTILSLILVCIYFFTTTISKPHVHSSPAVTSVPQQPSSEHLESSSTVLYR